MGALTRLLFFLQCFLSFCFQKGTVSLLRNVGYIPKACSGKKIVTQIPNFMSDSPDSSSEVDLHLRSMNQLMLSSNLDTPKKKFVEQDREGRKQLLETIQDLGKEIDQVSQTGEQGNETSKLPTTAKDAATVEAVKIAQLFQNREGRKQLLETIQDLGKEIDQVSQTGEQGNEASKLPTTAKDAAKVEAVEIAQLLSGRVKAEIDSDFESDSTSSSNEGEVYEQNIRADLGRRTVDNQPNERRINKNYGLFALVDTDEISQDNTQCPQCNSPCDYEDITDFGKCTVCKQKDLRDPSVHRVRNSDDRLSFFSNPSDKKFRASDKIVAQPLVEKEQNLLFEKLRREQEERLTYSPQTQTIPVKLKNAPTPPPITGNQNGRSNTNSGPESSISDKKSIQKPPLGGNIVNSNPLSKQNVNQNKLVPSNNGQINTQAAEFTDSENYTNLKEILYTEVFGKIDHNYEYIISLMEVVQYLEEDFKQLRKDFEDYKKLCPKEPFPDKKPFEDNIPF